MHMEPFAVNNLDSPAIDEKAIDRSPHVGSRPSKINWHALAHSTVKKSSHKSTRCSLRREAVAFLSPLLFAHTSLAKATPPDSFRLVVSCAAPPTYVHGESATVGPWPTDRAALFAGVYCWKHTKIPCKTYYPGKAPAGRNIAPPSRPAGRTCVPNVTCTRTAAEACGMSSRQERAEGVRAWPRRGLSVSCQHGTRTPPGRAHAVASRLAAGKPLGGRTWQRAEPRRGLHARQRDRGGIRQRLSPGRKTPPAAVRAMPRATRLLRLPAPDAGHRRFCPRVPRW